MNIKKILSLLLAVLMLGAALVSCNKTPDNEGEETTSGVVESSNVKADGSEGGEETGMVEDDLPDDLNYGGREFLILCGEGQYGKSYAEQNLGDILNSAVYKRQQTVQDRLGVELVFDLQESNYTTMGDITSRLASGADTWDLAQVYNLTPALMATEGVCVDMASTKYLNFDKPWWSPSLKENIAINGKIYFMTDGSSWNNLRNMMALFVDKTLFEINNTDKSIEDVYDLVENNAWTMEEMFSLAKGCYKDTDADNQVTAGDTNINIKTVFAKGDQINII